MRVYKMTEYYPEFLAKLKALCLEYDAKAGYYPDQELEGFALLFFALHPEYDPSDEYHKVSADFEDDGKEYLEELAHKKTDNTKSFEYEISKDELEFLYNYTNNDYCEKSIFFKDISPDWLADKFVVKQLNITDKYPLYKVIITPLDKLTECLNEFISDSGSIHKPKHEVVAVDIGMRKIQK